MLPVINYYYAHDVACMLYGHAIDAADAIAAYASPQPGLYIRQTLIKAAA